jgi:hypothetical protein
VIQGCEKHCSEGREGGGEKGYREVGWKEGRLEKGKSERDRLYVGGGGSETRLKRGRDACSQGWT